MTPHKLKYLSQFTCQIKNRKQREVMQNVADQQGYRISTILNRCFLHVITDGFFHIAACTDGCGLENITTYEYCAMMKLTEEECEEKLNT